MIISNIIQPSELLEWIGIQKDIQIIDLSNDNLLARLNINSLSIPVHQLFDRVSELSKNKPVILCCNVGSDSFFCMNILAKDYEMDNVFSLKSGINGLSELLEIE